VNIEAKHRSIRPFQTSKHCLKSLCHSA